MSAKFIGERRSLHVHPRSPRPGVCNSRNRFCYCPDFEASTFKAVSERVIIALKGAANRPLLLFKDHSLLHVNVNQFWSPGHSRHTLAPCCFLIASNLLPLLLHPQRMNEPGAKRRWSIESVRSMASAFISERRVGEACPHAGLFTARNSSNPSRP
jgi:hypothetical protein